MLRKLFTSLFPALAGEAPQPMSTFDGLIVGLGNPGPKYAGTRHNLGFALVDALLEAAGRDGRAVREQSGSKFRCLFWRVELPDRQEWLVAKPETFMNLSGESVQPLAAWHRIAPDRILVAHDELDLPPGRMRFKFGGGNAGHNGLTSITQRLGTPDFYRLRLGIGRPPHGGETVNWVLGHFSATERAGINELLPAAVEVVHTFARSGLEATTRKAGGFRLPEPDKD